MCDMNALSKLQNCYQLETNYSEQFEFHLIDLFSKTIYVLR